MAYRFNNARGGVTCDDCNILYDEDLGFKEYSAMYRVGKSKDDKDLCWKCKAKEKGDGSVLQTVPTQEA